MSKKRFSREGIIGKLRHADVLLGQGKKVAEIVKALRITDVTYYRWRQEFGSMTTTLFSHICGGRGLRLKELWLNVLTRPGPHSCILQHR